MAFDKRIDPPAEVSDEIGSHAVDTDDVVGGSDPQTSIAGAQHGEGNLTAGDRPRLKLLAVESFQSTIRRNPEIAVLRLRDAVNSAGNSPILQAPA